MRKVKGQSRRVHPVSTYRCLYSQFTNVLEPAYTAIDAIQTNHIDVNGSDYIIHYIARCLAPPLWLPWNRANSQFFSARRDGTVCWEDGGGNGGRTPLRPSAGLSETMIRPLAILAPRRHQRLVLPASLYWTLAISLAILAARRTRLRVDLAHRRMLLP